MLKVLTVCGMGLGSSMVLKMTLNDVFSAEGIEAKVQEVDVGAIKGMDLDSADIIASTSELKSKLESSVEGASVEAIYIDNAVDTAEVKNKVEKALENLNLKKG